MAKRHMKRCSTLLIIREIQIKTRLSPYTSQNGHCWKSTNNKCWRECGEKGTLLHHWWEWKLVQPLWKTVWRFLRKLKQSVAIWSSYLTPGHISGKTIIWKDSCTPMFRAALFTIAKTRKECKCPSIDEWIKKPWYIYTMEHYSVIKKKKIIPLQQHECN